MAATETGERRADLKTQLLARLHDPLQLRLILTGLVLVIGYAGVYTPLVGQIADTTARLAREQKMSELALSLEQLQARCSGFAKRIPQQADSKEWIQYMHEGVRRLPVKLTKLDCLTPRRVGPYKAVVLTMAMEGSFFDLDQFLRWLESNPRLLRVDTINISLAKGDTRGTSETTANKDDLMMQLTVLGMGS